MNKAVRVIVQALTAVAWLILIVDALPVEIDPPGDLALLVQTVACMGLFAILFEMFSAPVVEVYLAGKRAGRSEVIAEQECGVVQLAERRLSAVND